MEVKEVKEVKKISYRGLIFSGGGLMGFAYIGCLKVLEELNMIGPKSDGKIKFFGGCSIGAVFAAIVATGYTAEELYDFVLHFEYEMVKDLNFIGLLEDYGIETGNKIKKFIQAILKRKIGVDDPTFMDVYTKTGSHLVINATCVNTRNIEYFDWKTHPNMPVSLAIRMSISIPILFVPVKYDGKLYVDGGVIDNFPVHLYNRSEITPSEILGFKLESNRSNLGSEHYEITSLIDFIHNTWRSQYGELLRVQLTLLKDYTFITIPIDGKHTLNLNMTQEERIDIYNQGYNCAKNYLQKELVADAPDPGKLQVVEELLVGNPSVANAFEGFPPIDDTDVT